jgi:hypothetical protein
MERNPREADDRVDDEKRKQQGRFRRPDFPAHQLTLLRA